MGRNESTDFRQQHGGRGYSRAQLDAMHHKQEIRGGTSNPSSTYRETYTPTSSSRSTTAAAAQQQHNSNTAAPAGGCLTWNETAVRQQHTLLQKNHVSCSGHGSSSEGEGDRYCPHAQLHQEQANQHSHYTSSYADSDDYADSGSDEESQSSTQQVQQAILGKQEPAVRHQSLTHTLTSHTLLAAQPMNSNRRPYTRVLATNLPAEIISKYWREPLILWSNGNLVHDVSSMPVQLLPRLHGVYMFQARAPDAKGWVNLALGKADGKDGVRQSVQTYINFNKGTITLDPDDKQKHIAMLNLQHRNFDMRLLYKITQVYTAAESEAKKLREFKFPFDKRPNGNMRCINPYIKEAGKRVNDYSIVYSAFHQQASNPLVMEVICQGDESCT